MRDKEQKQGICILGSTGSIGQNTLNVLEHHLDKFQIVALCAHRSYKLLFEQCLKFEPQFAVMSDLEAGQKLKALIDTTSSKTRVLTGEQALLEMGTLPEVDKVMSAIVGAKGLLPTLKSLEAGKTVLIANKEPLVMAGKLMLETAKQFGATILPVDSEHNAIFQCLPDSYHIGEPLPNNVQKLVLTASGGAFLHYPQEKFSEITPEMACKHPNWKMGPKITIDCATLMNKGLEVIEASVLFGVPVKDIDVIVHPESVVHALVHYCDATQLAHLGSHDMRIAIAHCLAWPQRIKSKAPVLDLIALGQLNFLAPDYKKFPCLKLAYDAGTLGQAAPTVLNASNEMVVQAFLNQQINFVAIPTIIEKVLNQFYDLPANNLDEILAADEKARREASKHINLFSN